MTRVLHVITGLEHGGAERQLALLLRQLHRTNATHLPVTCEVVSLTGRGAVGAEIAATGVPVHELGMSGNRDLSALPRLVRLIRRGRYDVVHTHLYRACVYGRIAARLAGVPRIIATEHSLGEGHMEGRRTTCGVQALYLATERLGSLTVAVSPTVAGRLHAWGVRPERVAVVPNAIDAAAFAFDPARRAATRAALGIGAGDPVVGAVGRLVPTKRFDLLVEALARPPLAGARLLLVGDGPERAALARLAAARGVADRVHFAGGTADVAGHLAAMDVFAAPSVQEAFGLSVLEALAAGLPVLYTTCPALEDLPPDAAPTARRLPQTPAPNTTAPPARQFPRGTSTSARADAAPAPARSAASDGAAPPARRFPRDMSARAAPAPDGAAPAGRRFPRGASARADAGLGIGGAGREAARWGVEIARLLPPATGTAGRAPAGSRARAAVPPAVARHTVVEQAALLARLYAGGPPGGADRGADRAQSGREVIPT